jgi:hypothetical protein
LRSTYGIAFDPRNFDETQPYYYFGPVRAYPRFWCDVQQDAVYVGKGKAPPPVVVKWFGLKVCGKFDCADYAVGQLRWSWNLGQWTGLSRWQAAYQDSGEIAQLNAADGKPRVNDHSGHSSAAEETGEHGNQHHGPNDWKEDEDPKSGPEHGA